MNKSITARAPFFLLWICGASLRLTVLAVPPVISLMQRDLNLSGTEIGLLSGIPVVVFGIFAAPGSIVVARMGVRGALVCGLLVAAGGALLRIGVSNAWQLYLTSLLMSAGIAVMQPAMAAAVREWMPERSAFGTAVYTNGLILGEIIPVATMLPLVLPYFDGSWRPALGVWSFPLIATAVVVAVFAPKSAASVSTSHAGRWLPQWNSRLNWRIGLTLGSTTSTYFCLNGFLPAFLNGNGRQDLVSAALTALNAGQVPASFLLLITADKLQGKRWPLLALGALFSSCVVGIMISASAWTVFWAGLAGFSLAASLVLALALAPLLCNNPDDVALTSAAAFAISYGFAMLISLLSGVAWDLAGNVNAALIPILFGSFPVLVAAPTFERKEP
ncbi:MAG TPA: MFS transporter [Bradyrhizobium sp.]|uniref:MFS transporter n=1 Tax=Bradyrhizobium sp. TaxID=376 RepID=UPI002C0878F5|nr:MFS transporter [Bradyrhizobium sp.]HLZ02471.1 MFS transporter [Bradyrhizobium sp.]